MRRARRFSESIVIDKMANGWQVTFPFRDEEEDYTVYQDQISAVVENPIIKKLLYLAEVKIATDAGIDLPEEPKQEQIEKEPEELPKLGELQPAEHIFVFNRLTEALEFIQVTIDALESEEE